ncbi:hypothetical protein FJZ26_01630 [Candidatus Parvarchaeota archaeon]|nr:hypothetical protein [Candidatus Parvarchaeota archaeon]
MENFLLVGSGGREHAIADAVCKPGTVRLFVAASSNNPGILNLCKNTGGELAVLDIHNPKAVLKFAKGKHIGLAFSSPDATLAAGVSDELIKAGIKCASPTRAASRLEWDKAYARRLMKKYRIAGCPEFGIFSSPEKAYNFIDSLEGRVAIKPVGLTGGKGVKVAGLQLHSIDDAKNYVKEILSDGIGKVGRGASVVIEEKLEGEEFTLQAFCDGTKLAGMPLVQDHKLAYSGDHGPNCYSSDTEILTEDGWKTFDKLDKNKKVAIFQPRFRRIRFEKPTSIYWRKYTGKMMRFSHREIDLLVTPNHRMLVQSRKGGKFRVIEAKDWQGENLLPQTGIWIGTQPRFFRIPASTNRFGPKFKGIKINFGIWAAFIGLFLSEGFVSTQKRGGARVTIAQSRTSKYYSVMHSILKKLPFHVMIDKKGFRINSIQLADVLKKYGHAHEKFVPSYIKGAKPAAISLFLESYLMGDGDVHRGQMRICTSSKRMVDDIQELFMKTGKIGIITVDKRTQMLNPLNKKIYKARPIYSIEAKKRRAVGIRKKNISSVDYSGNIGCVTVSTGFVVVRRNGRVAICGNTGGMGSYSCDNHLLPFVAASDYFEALRIMTQTVNALKKDSGKEFVGVLYGQFMKTAKGLKIIEFNARFGDPEAMNVLTIFQGDLYSTFLSMANRSLEVGGKFAKLSTVCKYLVPNGYPEKSVESSPLRLDVEKILAENAKYYFASVDLRNGIIYTLKSRTVGIIGFAHTLPEAQVHAENACRHVSGPVWHREDIGTQALIQKRIDHVRNLISSRSHQAHQ